MAPEKTNVCQDCQISFPATISFCTKCGKPLTAETTEAPTSVPTQDASPRSEPLPAEVQTPAGSLPAPAPGLFGALIRDLHALEEALPWNAVSFGAVWVFLAFTYFL